MGLLKFLTSTGKAVTGSSDAAVAAATTGYAFKLRIDGGLFQTTSLANFGLLNIAQVDDGAATPVVKAQVLIEGTASTTFVVRFRTATTTLFSSNSYNRADFAAGTYVVLYVHHFNTAPGSGFAEFITIYDDAGNAVGAGAKTQTGSNGNIQNTAGGHVRLMTEGGATDRNVDGFALYSGEPTNKYNEPTASDTGILGYWPMDETTGAVVDNKVTGGVDLALAGTENTDFQWAAGGTWDATAASPTNIDLTANTLTLDNGSLLGVVGDVTGISHARRTRIRRYR